MKRSIAILFLFLILLAILPASPYLGVSQGLKSTALEVGFITNSIDQNLGISLPLLEALDAGEPWYRYPVASMNILYKKRIGRVFALGFGPTLRMGWEYEKAICLQAGLLLQLSLEAPGARDILFCELGYLPEVWRLLQGVPSSDLLKESIGQFVRFGYRHAF